MKKLVSNTINFFALPLGMKWNIFRIITISTITYLKVTYLPARYYYYKYHFGTYSEPNDLKLFRKEIRLIRKVTNLLPIRITCLMESLIIQTYYKKHNFIIPIVLGVKRNDELSAHAWVVPSERKGYKSIFR